MSHRKFDGIRHRRWAVPMLLVLLLAGNLSPFSRAVAAHAIAAPAVEQETYTHTLTQSTAALQAWTAPPSRRIFQDDPLPTTSGNAVQLYAAANEFEPFQIAVKPTTATQVQVTVGDFGSGITTELSQVDYLQITQASDSLGRTGPYPDPLWPLENGALVDLAAEQNTAFWFTVNVPKGTTTGDYSMQVQIGELSIPVHLHVFNFAVPDELHVKSQMNFSHQAILQAYGVQGTGDEYWFYVDKIKQFFIDHRLTPKGPLWSGGLTSSGGAPYIDYDCTTKTFSDPHGIWGFEVPAHKYLNGQGFNDGTGFPSFMAATFRNNDASADQRPASFCGESRSEGDWYGANNPNSPYNQQWFSYMGAIERYLNGLGYLDKAYYYMANEPQDQADYDAVAWYAQELKKVAPNFKLMVSEEPKPQIYNHPTYPGAKIDIWLPVLNQYDPAVSHTRMRDHGEETWIYWLYGTRPPFFNPITLDHPGIESKLTGWFLWKYRIRGIAYYSLNNWGKNPWTDPMTSGHNGDTFMLYPPARNNQPIGYGSNGHRFVPSIRLELMRDSLEEYEYLYLLANGQPQVDLSNSADALADKMISGLTSYTRDDDFLYNLRRLIGLHVGGEIDTIPDIQPPSSHSRADGPPGNYYLNFQDPSGEPTANPLVIDGNEYMKIGWNEYAADPSLGYGWYGDMAHVEYRYLNSGPNPLQRSVIYDDWGRQKSFEFDLPNGVYNVTVSVGWQGRTYSHNQVVIEGVPFVTDEASDPYIVRTKEVTIADNKLTMAMGIFDEYTMLNYLNIEAVEQAPTAPTAVADLQITNLLAGTDSITATLQWTPPHDAITTTLRYGTAPLTNENWANATPLVTRTATGKQQYDAILPASDKTYFFAVRAQNSAGLWSPISNPAFWPREETYLPVIYR